MESKRLRWAFALIFSVCTMVVCGLIAVLAGSHHLSLIRAFRGISPDREILMELRLPRAWQMHHPGFDNLLMCNYKRSRSAQAINARFLAPQRR